MSEVTAKRLQDKVAVVTGGGSGIGLATTKLFLEHGAKVVVGDLNERSLDELRAPAEDGDALLRVCDVQVERDVAGLVEAAKETFGGLDVMFNCAGICPEDELASTDVDLWDEVMAINGRGVFLGCKHALPAMIERGGGSIVNVGSINSFVAEKLHSAYVASKGAVLMLTKAAAAEFAPHNVRVNAVCPGAVDTPLNHGYWDAMGGLEEGLAWMAKFQPLGGMLEPEDIAKTVLYLACDDSARVTGTSVVVDAGLMAHFDHD